MNIFGLEISTMNLILWGCVIWMPAFYYLILSNEAKFKKNISVGVTLPQEAREDDAVLALLSMFKKRLLCTCIVVTLIALPCMLIPRTGSAMTVWILWLLAGIVFPYIPYVQCHKKLKQLKEERGWKQANKNVHVADLSGIAVNTKWLTPQVFLLPLVVSMLPVFFDRSMALLYWIDAATVLFCWFGYRYLYRNKAEIVDNDMAVAEALTRIRRTSWGHIWLLTAWFMAALSLISWLTQNDTSALISILLLSAILVIAILYVELNTRKLQEKLTVQSGTDFYVDEDDKWIWGMFYYNPNDNRLIINSRTGSNTTVNLAKRSGQIFMGATALLLLCMPLLGIWMDKLETTPVGLEITETAIISTHTGVEYEVALDTITYVEYVAEKPKLKRAAGTGMETVQKGRFGTPWGSARICLDPRTLPYIYLETDDGERYLFGSSDAVETETIYQELLSKTNLIKNH